MCYLSKIKKVYGPYTRKDGRKHVCIVLTNGKKITRSYPKYMKELELGRELDPYLETIDHKDRDFRNDFPDNIQIISRSDNAKKSALRRKEIIGNCLYCSVEIVLTRHQIRSRSENKAGPFCSKVCVGRYGSDIQNSKIQPFNVEIINVEYFRLDD